jgi:hypothetical protein
MYELGGDVSVEPFSSRSWTGVFVTTFLPQNIVQGETTQAIARFCPPNVDVELFL